MTVAMPVDLVGHAWFLKKPMLRFMWAEEPVSWENGEDIHLSYMALKHGGLGTYVPAHPEGEPDALELPARFRQGRGAYQ